MDVDNCQNRAENRPYAVKVELLLRAAETCSCREKVQKRPKRVLWVRPAEMRYAPRSGLAAIPVSLLLEILDIVGFNCISRISLTERAGERLSSVASKREARIAACGSQAQDSGQMAYDIERD
jgi:hypothetical protein